MKQKLILTVMAVLLVFGFLAGSLMTLPSLQEAYAGPVHYYGCFYRPDGTRLYCAEEVHHDHSSS